MQKAVYPAKLCREGMMSEQGLGYWCDLPLLHAGPHASFSIPYTVRLRDAWEEEHPDWPDTPNDLGDVIV